MASAWSTTSVPKTLFWDVKMSSITSAKNASNPFLWTMETVISITVRHIMNTDVQPVNAGTILLMMVSVRLWNWDALDTKEANALIASPITSSKEAHATCKAALTSTASLVKNATKNTSSLRVVAEWSTAYHGKTVNAKSAPQVSTTRVGYVLLVRR